MKTLKEYIQESILKSVGAGKARIIDIIKCPEENNIDTLNEIWRSLNLKYDGYTSFWKYVGNNHASFFIVSKDKYKTKRQLCLIGKWGIDDIVVDLYDRGDEVKKEDLVKWYEKVAKVLNMKITKENDNLVYLNFSKK